VSGVGEEQRTREGEGCPGKSRQAGCKCQVPVSVCGKARGLLQRNSRGRRELMLACTDNRTYRLAPPLPKPLPPLPRPDMLVVVVVVVLLCVCVCVVGGKRGQGEIGGEGKRGGRGLKSGARTHTRRTRHHPCTRAPACSACVCVWGGWEGGGAAGEGRKGRDHRGGKPKQLVRRVARGGGGRQNKCQKAHRTTATASRRELARGRCVRPVRVW